MQKRSSSLDLAPLPLLFWRCRRLRQSAVSGDARMVLLSGDYDLDRYSIRADENLYGVR